MSMMIFVDKIIRYRIVLNSKIPYIKNFIIYKTSILIIMSCYYRNRRIYTQVPLFIRIDHLLCGYIPASIAKCITCGNACYNLSLTCSRYKIIQPVAFLSLIPLLKLNFKNRFLAILIRGFKD